MVGAVSPIGYGVAPAAFQRIGSVSRSAAEPGSESGAGRTDQAQKPAQAAAGSPAKATSATSTNALGLTAEQQAQVEELKKRDQEVRRHEAAHTGAGGPYAGSPTFTYTTGPDGKRYATGGEVSIDASPVAGDPAATVQKLRTVIAAALAPADPSGQDRAVAAQAQAALAQAQAELAKSSAQSLAGGGDQEQRGQGASDDKGRFAQATSAYRGASDGGRNAVSSLIGGLVA
jgi:hypothetical protein